MFDLFESCDLPQSGGWGLYGSDYLEGQTFTPQVDHVLSEIRLYGSTAGYPSGNIEVKVYATDGTSPSGSVLSSGLLVASVLTGIDSTIKIPMSLVTLQAGTKYLFTVCLPDGDASNNFIIGYRNGGYARGNEVYSLDAGLTWSAGTGQNLIFEERGSTDSVIDSYTSGGDYSLPVAGTVWFGQGVTPSVSSPHFVVRSVDFYVRKVGSPPGLMTLSLRSVEGGKPSGPDLCSASVTASDISTAYEWVNFKFTNGYKVPAGTQLAIVYRLPDGFAGSRVDVYEDTSAPTYSGGAALQSDDEGVTWNSPYTGTDTLFRIWGYADTPGHLPAGVWDSIKDRFKPSAGGSILEGNRGMYAGDRSKTGSDLDYKRWKLP